MSRPEPQEVTMPANNPRFITFTGIDARTDLSRCEALSARYPIEWGILFGGNPEKNRYPEEDVIDRARAADIRRSAHLCNAFADKINSGRSFDLIHFFERLQVNRVAGCYDLGALAEMAAETATEVIIQHRSMDFPAPVPGLAFLQDQSGGRGVLPSYWARPHDPEQLVGYAGGLNPENVADAVRHMPAREFWIDMETGVRTDDWLDLDKCEAVCRAVFGEPA
jgi:hypothetical protein